MANLVNAGTPWNTAEDTVLRDMHAKECSIGHIANHLGRSYGAIQSRMEHVNLTRIRIPLQPLNPFKKEKIMQTNNVVTLEVKVGTRLAKELSAEQLMDIIDQEEVFIKRLKGLTLQSVAVVKLLKKHQKNLVKLFEVLDTSLTT